MRVTGREQDQRRPAIQVQRNAFKMCQMLGFWVKSEIGGRLKSRGGYPD